MLLWGLATRKAPSVGGRSTMVQASEMMRLDAATTLH